MKYHPFLLTLLCVKRYLTEEVYQQIVNELKDHGYFSHSELMAIISKYFDIETLVTNPLDIRDAWVYTYILFRRTKGFRMEEVIALYEKELAPEASSKYVVHLRHKEVMDIIKRIKGKPLKAAKEINRQLTMF